jgi:hypothetical protein
LLVIGSLIGRFPMRGGVVFRPAMVRRAFWRTLVFAMIPS